MPAASRDLGDPSPSSLPLEPVRLPRERAQASLLQGERHEAQSLPLAEQIAGQLSDMEVRPSWTSSRLWRGSAQPGPGHHCLADPPSCE